MRKAAFLGEGCMLAAVVMAGLAVFGVFMLLRSMVGALPMFMTEADRVEAHLQAQQALAAYHNSQPWDPWTTGAKEFAVIGVFAGVGILALGGSVGFLAGRMRQWRWVWARDGILPIRARQLEPGMALQTVGAHHHAEIENARRALPPAHMHVTGKAEMVEGPKEEEHHEAPPFGELWQKGEFASNGG